MAVFYFSLVVTFILSLGERILRKKTKMAVIVTITIIAIFSIVSGLRNNIGDTQHYIHLYNVIDTEYETIKGAYESGFLAFLLVLKRISTDPQFMLIITSIIINTLNIWTIRKYTKDSYYELGVFMYIASGYYLVTMNGIRQALVAAILFAAVKYIIEGKFIKYLLLIILMMYFHNSVFVMIPIYFIGRTEAWSKQIRNLLIIFCIGILCYQPAMEILFSLLKGTRYSAYDGFNAQGANILRVVVSAVPVLLAYFKREELKEWKYNNIFVNISLINFIVMTFSKFTWIFARFSIYTQLYTFVLLPVVIDKAFKNKKEKVILYYFLIGCYIIFFFVEHKLSLNIIYESNFKLSDIFYNVIR